jgi:hypothetical protein
MRGNAPVRFGRGLYETASREGSMARSFYSHGVERCPLGVRTQEVNLRRVAVTRDPKAQGGEEVFVVSHWGEYS